MIIQSISGVRGITETAFPVEAIKSYVHAFHNLIPAGLIYIGRDSRPSGENLIEIISEELTKLGRDVVDCGIAPTPTVQFMVERSEASGGLIVTASHNPDEWNGIKFVREDGTFFYPNECEQLYESVAKKTRYPLSEKMGMVLPDQNCVLKHVISTIELSCIDLKSIKKRKFKVVIDAVNGAGSDALPLLLEYLGCEVFTIYCNKDGKFKRGTEPLPENLSDLSNKVIESKADIGFAIDPDADRLAVVNEMGKPLGEEYTLVIAAESYLINSKKPEKIVTNLSTTMALEHMAAKFDSTVIRTAVGEINVVKRMKEENANLGGEGNGGVILKEAHLGRDSLVAAAMILNRLAQDENSSVEKLFKSLPFFTIVKDKIDINDTDEKSLISKAQTLYSGAAIDTTDGTKFCWDDKWVHLRKSNTEPIIRIYAEASSEEEAKKLISLLKE